MILGLPTLIVPSPVIGCSGSPYCDVGRWGVLSGCLCDMVVTLTLPSASGSVKIITGCLPMSLWQ